MPSLKERSNNAINTTCITITIGIHIVPNSTDAVQRINEILKTTHTSIQDGEYVTEYVLCTEYICGRVPRDSLAV